MLTAGILLFDDQGRIRTTQDAPTDFNGGTPTAHGGLLSSDRDVDPFVYLAGLGYGPQSRLTDTASPLNPIGPFVNDKGQVRVSGDPPAYWYAGLPFTADGMLSVVDDVAPMEFAFSSAFSNAFDSPSAA